MTSREDKQFAFLLAEFQKVTRLYAPGQEQIISEYIEDAIKRFSEIDSEKRSVLLHDLRTMVDVFKAEIEIEAETGQTSLEVMFDVLDNPSRYTREEVATAERSIEDFISDQEKRLQAARARDDSGEVEAISAFLSFIKARVPK